MSRLSPPLNKNDHLLGPHHAPIELVEYGDFQCPFCGAAHPVIKQIIRVLDKKLRFAFRHFPLSNAHEYALPAAIAAEAAGKQNRFWEMHDIIYEQQDELSNYALLAFANEIRLNISKFRMDLLDESLAEKVESDFESGMRSGVNGTPSFFINGYKYNGGIDYDSLLIALEESAVALK